MKKTFKDGIHNISNEDYHASDGVSRSALWTFRKSPYHYWHQYINPEYVRHEPTYSMIVGELVHAMSLEHNRYLKDYVVSPDVNKRTKAGKEVLEQFAVANIDKIIIDKTTHELADKMAVQLKYNNLFCSLVADAKIEQSIYFTHKQTGIQCKVRPDAWLGSVVTDLKTTADMSYRAFQMSAYKFGYFLQAGMIHEALDSLGIKLEKFVFACVENKEPHAVGLYDLDEEGIDFGVEQFNTLMSKFEEKQKSQDWFSYELQTLCVPNWANYED